MEGAAKLQPGRNLPINRPQFLGENKFMENNAGTAEQTASLTYKSVRKSRGYRHACLPTVKAMARCAVLLMGLSLVSGCASSPGQSLTQIAQSALPASLGPPELVETAGWYVIDGLAEKRPGPCDDAIAIFSDRFFMLTRIKTPRTVISHRIVGYDRNRQPITRSEIETKLECDTLFSKTTAFFYRDNHPMMVYHHRGSFFSKSYKELRVPFGPPLSQPGGPPMPKVLVIEVSPESEIPRILEQRRGR
jgi:hypothetical protein